MTAPAPTFSQIKAQVSAIRQKIPQARVIGIRAGGRWTDAPRRQDGADSYAVYQCDSPLAMRLALREPADESTIKVLITDVDEQHLSHDILLRLAKRRLFQIDSWQIVRSLCDAQAIDPRLTRHPWMAEALLELIPPAGYPAARGGFLDAETVWPLLLRQAVGLEAESPDLTSLLKWSQDAALTTRFQQSSEPFRTAAAAWLTEKAGPVAEVLLRSVERLQRPDALPVGLAAGVVYHPSAAGRLEKATGKLEERFLCGQSPDPDLMRRWSTAAVEVVRTLRHTDAKQYRWALARTDEILSEIQADGWAHLSDTSPLGFDQRMARLGRQLAEVLERQTGDLLDELYAAHSAVKAHDQATREARRLERVEMALRLVRWLSSRARQEADPPATNADRSLTVAARDTSFAEAAGCYLREGGFVDWARLCLWRGEPVGELSAAYSQLFEAVRRIREQQSETFARLLADWTNAGSQGDGVLPVEQILEQIVAPLAADRLVLVIVIDGMSVAVCRELLADLAGHDWMPICEPGRDFNRPGLAAIPSVTEFSRTSLLCGRLQQGDARDETAGFAEHPALLAHSRSGSPPLLFHKAGLEEADDTILAKDVRAAIQSTHRRVVGVVVNAVDDHLLKGDQIDTRWSRDEIRVLPILLHEARVARRLVVLVSDHGHILDCQAQGRPGDAGERYRTATGAPAEDELLIEGRRVLTEDHRLIAPWSEQVRYGGKKNGYHGGLTPQEMVVPIVVLSSTDDFPEGWSEQPIDTPAWWDEATPTSVETAQPAPKLKPAEPAPVKPKPSGTLFDLEAEVEAAPTAVSEPQPAGPEWIVRLLSSPVFEDQKRLGGRGLPADEMFANLLSVLDQRGGKLTSVALARALQFAPVRLPGLLAKAERVLNVDGYDILRRDDASDTIELNRDLLLKQFDLVEE